MHRVVETLSKMFVVLVLLFGSPPPVSLRQLHRRPVVALVSTAYRRADANPLGLTSDVAPPAPPSSLWWGQRDLVQREPRAFHPFQAA